MNALVGRLQVWLMLGRHRWVYLLGLASMVLGIVGFSADSVGAIVVGSAGFVLGVVGVAADRLSFRGRLQAMQISSVPRATWADVSPSPQHPDWVRVDTCTSPIVVSWPVNAWLETRTISLDSVECVDGDPAVTILSEAFQLREGHAPDSLAAYYVLHERIRSGHDVKDDRKVRLATDPVVLPDGQAAPIAVQQTSYFKGVLTNEFASKQILQRGSSVPLYRGIESCAGGDGVRKPAVLLPLGKSHASNHVGVSVLLMTSDGSLVIQVQGDRANQAAGKRVPCASGSMDWSDVRPGLGMITLSCRAALRELEEETRLTAREVASIRCVGLFRTLERGGKPEFVFLAHTDLDEAAVRTRVSSVRRRERRYVHSFEYWDLSVGDPREALTQTHHEVGDALSPSLDAALHLLERARWLE